LYFGENEALKILDWEWRNRSNNLLYAL